MQLSGADISLEAVFKVDVEIHLPLVTATLSHAGCKQIVHKARILPGNQVDTGTGRAGAYQASRRVQHGIIKPVVVLE
jgi:hypothetical protein